MKEMEERMSLADAEIKATLDWLCEEMEKISLQLKAEDFSQGLDGNQAAYAQMHAEFAQRMKNIGVKYNLPYKE